MQFAKKLELLGGVQGIKFNYDSFGNLINLHGGADPRRDGKALGY